MMCWKRIILIVCLLAYLSAQDKQHRVLELDKPYPQTLTSQTQFTSRYIFNLPQDKVAALAQDKWYFFLQVQPEQHNEWVRTTIELSIGEKGKEESSTIRTCATQRGGVDSCFLTNRQFDYKTQQIHAKVNCQEECKFTISAELSAPYKLAPNEALRLDFENTAYSKVFTLDTSSIEGVDQLRIILRPEGFLQFAAPIHLYVNKGTSAPSSSHHDYKGITLWDNGKGVFLDSPDSRGLYTILVEGPEKNVLQLSTQTVRFKATNDLALNQPYFDYIGGGNTKFYKVPVDLAKGVNLQTTTFSGGIKLGGLYDQDLKRVGNEFDPLYRSYSEMEYDVPASFFRENEGQFKLKQFVVFAIEGTKDSTFVLQGFIPSDDIVHLLPERNKYVELQAGKSKQYYIQVTQLNLPQFKGTEIEIITTSHEGQKLDPHFYECRKQRGAECQLTANQLSGAAGLGNDLTKLELQNKSFSMGVGVHKLNIPLSKFQQQGNETLVYLVVISIENKGDRKQLYTLQYLNQGTSRFLKEGQLIKERIALGEKKYYQFTNFDPDVEEVVVHKMGIAGKTHMVGYRHDPRKEDVEGEGLIGFRGGVRFDGVGVKETIYVEVEGVEAAYYSLQLQLIKKKEKQEYGKDDTSTNNTGFNEIILVDGIQYDFLIQPQSKAVYQIHTKEKEFRLDMNSLLPVTVCMTQELTKAPFSPNCQAKEEALTNRITLDVRMERGNIANVGVLNDNEKTVKFSIFFRPLKEALPENSTQPAQLKCAASAMGRLVKHSFKANTSSCYSYVTEEREGMQVVLDVASDEYDKVRAVVEVGGVEKRVLGGSSEVFEKEVMERVYQEQFPCTVTITITTQVSTDITLTAQMLNQPMELIDGIANEFHGAQTRHFIYEMVNKVNTSIIMENKEGYFKFYGKVVEASSYWKGETTFPDKSSNIITSNNPFYYIYQTALLSEGEIVGNGCEECMLLLTVERSEEGARDKSRFIIECTQQDRFLKEGKSIAGYVDHNSMAYYEYYNSKNGTMMVSVNTQHKGCAILYLKKGNDRRVSGSEYDKKEKNGDLILEGAQEGSYSIAVEGSDPCFYNIEAYSSVSKVYSRLERGIDKDIELNKDQAKRLVYKHTLNDTFRILTMHQEGQLTFSIKQYSSLKDLLNETRPQPKYDYSSIDLAIIHSNSSAFCFNCYYLIDVSASRSTKTSLMIPTEQSYFPIQTDSYIKDELSKGQVEHLRVFSSGEKSMFELRVHYGQVNISIYPASNDQRKFSEVYGKSDSAVQKDISNIFKEDRSDGEAQKSGFVFMRYLKIQIKAEKDSSFTFGMISDKDSTKRGRRVKLGQPEYVSINDNHEECIRGTFDNKEEEFLISMTGQKQAELMSMLVVKLMVGGKDQQLSKNIAKNEMLIKIDNSNKLPSVLPADYEFCMRSKENVYLTFIQAGSVNTFPQGKAIMVLGEQSLTFYSQGRSLVQLNQCGGRATVSISHQFHTAKAMNSEIRQVRKSNNIIEFSHYGPVFMHVNATSATVLWRQKDELSGRSMGYEEYSANKLRIDKSTDTMLNVQVFPLKKTIENAKVEIKMVNYTVFIAHEEAPLYSAMNCQDGMFLHRGVLGSYQQKSTIISIQIDQITRTFRDRRFILVGVLAIATPSDTSDIPYRFVYPYQQIPLDMLVREGNLIIDPIPVEPEPYHPQPIETEQPWGPFQIVVIALAVLLVGAFIARWAYRHWLKRWWRRRGRLADQESGDVRYTEFTSYN